MDAILDEDIAICQLLSYERPKSVHEFYVMLEVLKLHSEDFEDDAAQEERARTRTRMITAIQAALPSQPEVDPGKFGIEASHETATLLAKAAASASKGGLAPIGLAAGGL